LFHRVMLVLLRRKPLLKLQLTKKAVFFVHLTVKFWS